MNEETIETETILDFAHIVYCCVAPQRNIILECTEEWSGVMIWGHLRDCVSKFEYVKDRSIGEITEWTKSKWICSSLSKISESNFF